jgi:hypothetical protein
MSASRLQIRKQLRRHKERAAARFHVACRIQKCVRSLLPTWRVSQTQRSTHSAAVKMQSAVRLLLVWRRVADRHRASKALRGKTAFRHSALVIRSAVVRRRLNNAREALVVQEKAREEAKENERKRKATIRAARIRARKAKIKAAQAAAQAAADAAEEAAQVEAAERARAVAAATALRAAKMHARKTKIKAAEMAAEAAAQEALQEAVANAIRQTKDEATKELQNQHAIDLQSLQNTLAEKENELLVQLDMNQEMNVLMVNKEQEETEATRSLQKDRVKQNLEGNL